MLQAVADPLAVRHRLLALAAGVPAAVAGGGAARPPPPRSGDDGWPLDENRQRTLAAAEPPTPEILPLGTLYKRAAILALANPLMSLVLLFGVVLALALSSFALPAYPLIVMSLVALINCRVNLKTSPARATARSDFSPRRRRGSR